MLALLLAPNLGKYATHLLHSTHEGLQEGFMGLDIQAVKGMKDILPSQSGYWQYLEATFKAILDSYGYQEIRSPLVEETRLFTRAIGQVTDIVEKEMYTLEDKGGDVLSLRPEGTAQCVRAVLEHGLIYKQTQKLWYLGPMFRRENTQRGRLRQFHQLGVEAFGFAGPDIDIEMLLMTWRLWKTLNISQVVQLELNSLGTYEERLAYRQELTKYFTAHLDKLDEDSKRRLESNPLRILDSKAPAMQPFIEQAPRIIDFLGDESRAHFETITDELERHQVPFRVNTRLVRGLDYYTHTVYEWTSNLLGAQSAVCAGGRYDGLVGLIGGQPTPSTGFALGIERLLLLLQEKKCLPEMPTPDIYLIHDSIVALQLAEKLRDEVPGIKIVCHTGSGSVKNQFKKADKSGAKWAIVYADDERNSGLYTLKYLRERKEQQSLTFEALISFLKENI